MCLLQIAEFLARSALLLSLPRAWLPHHQPAAMSGEKQNNPWTSATPLSNADFKAMLSTPRPDWARSGSGSGSGAAHTQQRHAAAGGGGGRAREKPAFKPPKPRPKPAAGGQEEDEGPKYRCAMLLARVCCVAAAAVRARCAKPLHIMRASCCCKQQPPGRL